MRTSFEREEFLISRSTAADESELREEDVLSVTSSDPAGSALLAHGVRDVELLEVMKRGGTEKGEWLAVDLMSDLSLA